VDVVRYTETAVNDEWLKLRWLLLAETPFLRIPQRLTFLNRMV
jgi:hypothetical protein